MEAFVKSFWIKLEDVLELLAARLLTRHAGYKFLIGSSSNSVFPLRAYLTILKGNKGEELSITVDIKNQEDGLLIESDVVRGEGIIVADGPSLELHGNLSDQAIQIRVAEWFNSFDRLFVEKCADIEIAIKSLE